MISMRTAVVSDLRECTIVRGVRVTARSAKTHGKWLLVMDVAVCSMMRRRS
jgi:hypothetical protein